MVLWGPSLTCLRVVRRPLCAEIGGFSGKLSGQPGFRGRCSEGFLGSVVQSKAGVEVDDLLRGKSWVITVKCVVVRDVRPRLQYFSLFDLI